MTVRFVEHCQLGMALTAMVPFHQEPEYSEPEGTGGVPDARGWVDGLVPWIRICRGSAITEMYLYTVSGY